MAFGNFVQPTGVVQIMKRPISEPEQAMALGFWGRLQNSLRGLAAASLVFFILNMTIMTGSFPVPELNILFFIMALMFGIAALGMAGMTMGIRKKIAAAFQEGAVFEVVGPAYLNQTTRKMPSWNIGPVSVLQTPETRNLIAQGAPTSVVFIPGVRAVLSINGIPLRKGASIMVPPGLEAMAHPQPMYPMAPSQSLAPPQYPMAPPQQPAPPQYPMAPR
jgi:hypothetical protein